jgi:hypothetical protein
MKTLEEVAKQLRHKICRTSGNGLWSAQVRNVRIQSVKVKRTEASEDFPDCETFLLVKFDPKTWDVYRYGLIYTDPHFLTDLQQHLRRAGFDRWADVHYTEQGMQGDTYVHLIVGRW